jgi:hypothetical protein
MDILRPNISDGPNDFRTELRLRVTPCARRLLGWLSESFGPIVLLHSLLDQGSGTLSWRTADGFRPEPWDVVWAESQWGTLYALECDVPRLCETRLILEAALGGDPEAGVFCETRLVSLCQPYSDSELELAAYQARREARSAIERAIRCR